MNVKTRIACARSVCRDIALELDDVECVRRMGLSEEAIHARLARIQDVLLDELYDHVVALLGHYGKQALGAKKAVK